VVEALSNGETELARYVSRQFGVTRQAASHHLRGLIRRGVLRGTGATRRRRYSLPLLRDWSQAYPVDAELSADRVWRAGVRPQIPAVPEGVLSICHYGVHEAVANALHHSGAPRVVVAVECTAAWMTLLVSDEGVGIFRKVRDAARLDNDRDAVLELVKGRFTTEPITRSGEGVFYAARLFDQLVIRSGSLLLLRDRASEDWLVEEKDPIAGTHVWMRIRPWATHSPRDAFARYSAPAGHERFLRTDVPVSMAAQAGEDLVSRAQAQRLLARLSGFAEAVLDFRGVTYIGPAFADELFRVFPAQRPRVSLVVARASDEVRATIDQARGATVIP